MTPPAAAAAPAVRRARSTAPARPLTIAPRPRRVSGPARRERPRTQTERSTQSEGGLALGALAALRSVEHNPLLDRLIGSRTWIGLLAFALIGIVTLQLGLLKLNAGIGRTLEQMSSLQQANAALSIENSELAAGDRVEASAARLGMEIVPVGSLKSLAPRPHLDVARAASALNTPVHATSTIEASAEATATPTSASSTELAATATSTSESGETPARATAEPSSHESSPPTSESSSSTSASAGSSGSSEASLGSSAGSGSTGEATPAGGVQASPGG